MKASVFGLYWLAIAGLAAQQVAYEGTCGNVEVLGVVDPKSPDLEELTSTARQVLASHPAARLFYAVIGATEASVTQSLHRAVKYVPEPAKGQAPEPPDEAVRRSGEAFQHGEPVAAVLGLGNDAILARWAHAKSLGHTQLTGNQDPTRAWPGYSLLHAGVLQAKPGASDARITPCMVTMYFRSDRELSTSGGNALARSVHQLFRDVPVNLAIRNDDWFVEDDGFPDLPVLPERLAPPAPGTWLAPPEVRCSAKDWPREKTPTCGLGK